MIKNLIFFTPCYTVLPILWADWFAKFYTQITSISPIRRSAGWGKIIYNGENHEKNAQTDSFWTCKDQWKIL